jgi:geranylgeranyl diphosphate synthase type II
MDKVVNNDVLKGAMDSVFEGWRAEVEQGLLSLAREYTKDSSQLRDATTYVLEGAGKKLRALLILSIARDLLGSQGDLSGALRCALAVEALHAASLVHDDLPALDNDDYRRGRPSCHRAFNEATAILVGDLLVGVAFSSVSRLGDTAEMSAHVCSLLARTWSELCVGQQLDLQGVSDISQRLRMIELKTGALFGCAAACGALCARVEVELVERLFEWGVRVGAAFQKLDDVSDGECSVEEVPVVERECSSLIQELQDSFKVPMTYSVEIARRILDTRVTKQDTPS